MCYFVTYSVSVWVCVWVFCAFAYLWGGGQHLFLHGLDTQHGAHTRWQGDDWGETQQDLQRICCSQTTGACYPQTSVEPGHQSNGHYNNNNNYYYYHLSFIVGQTFLQAAQCTIFVTWGQVSLGWCFISKSHNLKKQNVTLSPCSFPQKSLISFIFNYCSL